MVIRTRSLVASVLAVALAVIATELATAREPASLRGSPLTGTTGLRLLVDDSTPFVFDVDTGSVTRLRGLTEHFGHVLGVSRNAAVVVDFRPSPLKAQVYLIRSGQTTLTALGPARDVVPAADGRALWVTRVTSKSHCVLQRLGLDGRGAAARAIPCRWVIRPGGSLGLVVRRARVIDPATIHTVTTSRRGVIAVAGDRLLLTGVTRYDRPDDRLNAILALRDSSARSERVLRIPRTTGSLGDPAVDPRGRYLALPYGNPAYRLGGSQVLDVWVVDSLTGAVTHMPASPAYVHLKATSIQWTYDGRLVLLGEDDDGAFVAVWRPGQRTLPLKRVRLPVRDGGSDSFAVLG